MAGEYHAPLDDMRFVMNELIDLDGLAELDGFDMISAELVEQVLDEAGRFASQVIAPSNQPGDRQGARLVNGVVRIRHGWKSWSRDNIWDDRERGQTDIYEIDLTDLSDVEQT